MNGPDPSPPPRYLGDPNGVHWSVDPPAGFVNDDALDFTVEGDVIKFMWDYGVVVPLWDGSGLVPEEPEWSRTALGLSDTLINDLTDWGNAMNHLDANPLLSSEQALADLGRRAKELVNRLEDELDPRFTVEYQPW
jgi:hypothetical protein